MKMKNVKFNLRQLSVVGLLTLGGNQLAHGAIQTQIYVSPNGDDSNAGTLAEPVKTLNQARNLVRGLNANMSGDIVVNLAEGDYHLTASFNLNESDSGSNGFKVIYKNLDKPGSARIIGGEKLTNWQSHQGNIYKTFVGTDFSFETLYVNGHRVPLARHPNTGYLEIVNADASQPRKAFFTNPGDIPSISDISNLQVYVWPGAHDWANEILPITSIGSDNKVTLSQDQRYPYLGDLKTGSRYFVQGAYELLDQPGEFYLDKAQGYLYYIPLTSDINSEDIIAPTVTKVIGIKGSSQTALAQNIEINGLTVMVSDYSYTGLNGTSMGNIIIENANDITIANNVIKNAALNGVALSATSANRLVTNVTVTGNDIYDIGSSGVVARGKGNTNVYTNRDHLISNNRISHIAKIATNGAGVQLSNAGYSTVSHNDISQAVHYGIEVKGSKWMLLPSVINGITVTEENKYDFNPGRYNLVEFNKVYHVNLDTQDTGIYKSGGSYQTTVNNNLFFDSGADFGIQKGIYLDDVSDYTTVINNVVYGLSRSKTTNPAMNVKGTGSQIVNNIFHFEDTALRLLEFNGQQTQDNTIERNIFYSENSNLMYDFVRGFENRLVTASDNNLFYGPGSLAFLSLPGVEDNLSGWQSLNNNSYDQNSTVADPLFVNSAQHDYSLQASSPALSLGFVPIDVSNVGLKEDEFVYIETADEQIPLFSDTDDFETGLGKWDTSLLGTPTTSTTQSHSGNSSYHTDEDKDQIGYQLPLETNGLVSVWFYDDASDSSMKVKARVANGANNAQIGVVTYASASFYSFMTDGSSFEVSTVPRTTGWHSFQFDCTSGQDCRLFIDGTSIATTSLLTSIQNIVLGDNAADGKQGNVYFDNLSVITDFKDGFELGFADWNTSLLGTATSGNETAAGQKSYALDEDRDQIGYQLPKPVNGVLTVKFFDQAADDSMKVKAMIVDSDNKNAQLGVVTYNSSQYYSYMAGGSFQTTNITRTSGWHEFKFDCRSGTSCQLSIDGNVVVNTTYVDHISKIILGDNASDSKDGAVYFDQVQLEVDVVNP